MPFDSQNVSSTDSGPNNDEQETELSRDLFECLGCGFASSSREEFDQFGLAMACPDCQSLRVEHVFTTDDDDAELVTDGGLPTCEDCGDVITHTVVAGPGEAKHSCGCDAEPIEVADDTENALANVAIRALNASGDVEAAAAIHEGTRGRLVADGGTVCGKRTCENDYEVDVRVGTAGTGARCGLHALEDAVDGVGPAKAEQLIDEFGSLKEISYAAKHQTVLIARLDGWSPSSAGELETKLKEAGVWVGPEEEEPVADGGVPESFDELASTCENCGDDVDPERLIEGECPGCHYHEPVADGGVSWYELHSFQRDILRVIAEIEAEGDTSYGLGIKRGLEERYTKEVNHGRLYPNLDDLVAFGLVEKSELDKRTNRYSLRDEGVAMLRRQKEDWDDLDVPEVVAVADGGDSA